MIKINDEIKKRIFASLIITFIFLSIAFYFYNEYLEECEKFHKSELNTIKAEISSLSSTYSRFADYIYQQVINNEDILEIMYNAYKRKPPYRDELRSDLLSLTENSFELIKEYDFGTMQFHFINGINFLRLNEPDYFGDNVFDYLISVKTASQLKEKVESYEIGKTFNGFRYVFPLKYENEYIGTVDIAVNLEAVINILKELYPEREIIYVLEKEALEVKMDESDISEYEQLANFNGFVLDEKMIERLSKDSASNVLFSNRDIFNKLKEQSIPKLNEMKEFSFVLENGRDQYLVQFIPIQNVLDITAGYFISISQNNQRALISSELLVQLILLSTAYLLSIALYIGYQRSRLRIKKLAERDFLTGLYNRKKFNELLNREIDRSLRYNHTFSLAMIDIDHFKEVNDKHGHKVGDKVLVEFADVIKENLRVSDIYARWGGEEFIVLMPETKIEQALKVAERLRKAVENYSFSDISKLTISIGVVQKPPLEMKIDEVIIRADNALYKAKNNGRNRVEKG